MSDANEISSLRGAHHYVTHAVKAPSITYFFCLNRAGRKVCVAHRCSSSAPQLRNCDSWDEEFAIGISTLSVSDKGIAFNCIESKEVMYHSGRHTTALRGVMPAFALSEVLSSADDAVARVEKFYSVEINARHSRCAAMLERITATVEHYKSKEGALKIAISSLEETNTKVRQISALESSVDNSKELEKFHIGMSLAVDNMGTVIEDLSQQMSAILAGEDWMK